MQLDTILKTALSLGSSDIHLVTGHTPMARVHTTMTALDFPVITADTALAMLKQMTTPEQMKVFDKIKDCDFSYEIPQLGRFRVNAHSQRGSVGIALRSIKTQIPPSPSSTSPTSSPA